MTGNMWAAVSQVEEDIYILMQTEISNHVPLFIPGRLTEIVEKAGAKSTDYQNLESAKEFSDKCVEKAEKWAPVAERLWRESGKGATEEAEEKANQVNHYCGTCRKCAGQSR